MGFRVLGFKALVQPTWFGKAVPQLEEHVHTVGETPGVRRLSVLGGFRVSGLGFKVASGFQGSGSRV